MSGPLLLISVLDVVAGTTVAVLAGMAARLTRRSSWVWLAGAAAAYSLALLPSDAGIRGSLVDAALPVLRIVVLAVAVVFLLVAARPAPETMTVRIPFAALFLAGVVTAAGQLDPALAGGVAPPVLVGWLLVGCAAAAAGAFLAIRACRPSAPTTWIGLGALLLAAAHAYEIVKGHQSLSAVPDPLGAFGRLAGLGLVAFGLYDLVRRASQSMVARCATLERRLSGADSAAARRDHELRNGLTGLAALPEILTAAPARPDLEMLAQAVRSELRRLAAILEGAGPVDVYRLDELVSDIAMLHARDARIAVPDDLWVEGRRDVAGQVLANLLINCARHAPGARVELRAGRSSNDRITLEVRDAGPGIPPDLAGSVLEPRVSGDGGSGLGLAVCRDLLAAEGADIRVETGEDHGCVATVELCAAGSPSAP